MIRFYEKNLREVYGETLAELGERDPRIVVLDADLNTSTCADKFKKRFPDRFIQCGIAEANMFSIAAGMAHMGYIPFPSTFACFAVRKALDPVFMNICCQKLSVKIPGSYPGLTATECGPSHNICEDIATMRALPHMRVAAAGDNNELISMMRCMASEEGPAYFRIPKAEMPRLFGPDHQFEWGRGYMLRSGKDVTIASTGMMTALALRAAELLDGEGISATVLHMPSIKPLDDELLAKAAKETGCVLTVENGRPAGGFGGAVAESLAVNCPVRMKMLGVDEAPARSSDLGTLLCHYGLAPDQIKIQATELVKIKD